MGYGCSAHVPRWSLALSCCVLPCFLTPTFATLARNGRSRAKMHENTMVFVTFYFQTCLGQLSQRSLPQMPPKCFPDVPRCLPDTSQPRFHSQDSTAGIPQPEFHTWDSTAMIPQPRFHSHDSTARTPLPGFHSLDSTSKIPQQMMLLKHCLGSFARVIFNYFPEGFVLPTPVPHSQYYQEPVAITRPLLL